MKVSSLVCLVLLLQLYRELTLLCHQSLLMLRLITLCILICSDVSILILCGKKRTFKITILTYNVENDLQ